MSMDDKDAPRNPRDDATARRWTLFRRSLLSGFTGAVLGLSLAAQVRGFYLGMLIGVAAQLLIRGLVGLFCGDRQDRLPGVLVSVLAGGSVGAVIAWIGDPDLLLVLLTVGGVVGLVDSIVSWVLFPSHRPQAETPAQEVESDPDADLRDGFPEDNGLNQ